MIVEMECKSCKGDGFSEEIKCTQPAWNCCGSCYEKEKCEDCDGLGTYEVSIDIEDVKVFIESGDIESEKI